MYSKINTILMYLYRNVIFELLYYTYVLQLFQDKCIIRRIFYLKIENLFYVSICKKKTIATVLRLS